MEHDCSMTEGVAAHIHGFHAGNAEAQCQLAFCCLENRMQAEIALRIAENQEVANELAKNFARGLFASDNDMQLFQVFSCARDANDPVVLCALGKCYQFGWGVSRNVLEAIECYVEAADLGSFDATEHLFRCKSKHDENRLKTAFEHFRQLADEGDVTAQFNVGCCYYYGVGVTANYKQAAVALKKAANNACGNATVKLGELYEYGHGVSKNVKKAVALYQQAAKAGIQSGQYKLACCFAGGIGVAKNYKQAARWYEKVAAEGHANAADKLATCYANGHGVRRSESKAFQYYRQAAIAGSRIAQNNMGFYNQKCKDTLPDYQKMLYWYGKAMDQGSVEAAATLREYRSEIGAFPAEMSEDEPASVDLRREVGFCLAKLAAAAGCTKAFVCVGDCYFRGFTISKNARLAAENYMLAVPHDTETLLKIAECYISTETGDENEIDAFCILKQVNCSIRSDINAIMAQMR